MHADDPPTVASCEPAAFPKLNEAVDPAAVQSSACVMATLARPMVTVPDRAGPLLAVALSVTVPPPRTRVTSALSQAAAPLDTSTSYPQWSEPLTATPPAPVPSAPNVTVAGSTPGAFGHGAAACSTRKYASPTLTLPSRAPPLFASTLMSNGSSTANTLRELTVIQSSSSLTSHSQSLRPDTDTLRVPPADPNATNGGYNSSGSSGHCASCLIATPRPSSLASPTRGAPLVFEEVVSIVNVPPPNTGDGPARDPVHVHCHRPRAV